MGNAHILYVYEDGIRNAVTMDNKIIEEKATELGTAILKVSLVPGYHTGDDGPERIRSHPLHSHGNCVNHVDDPHSTEAKLYLWFRNCLRPIHKLKTDELAVAKSIIDDQLKERGVSG
ncbi:MAG: hypothetical protein A2Y66_01520 [Nitrospirae bacterium RBG_13_41_22]|nr:MAG: hypothetical protein A2Y66_01520 [Nitrospirae bacterium RBG_13_41_22]